MTRTIELWPEPGFRIAGRSIGHAQYFECLGKTFVIHRPFIHPDKDGFEISFNNAPIAHYQGGPSKKIALEFIRQAYAFIDKFGEEAWDTELHATYGRSILEMIAAKTLALTKPKKARKPSSPEVRAKSVARMHKLWSARSEKSAARKAENVDP